MSVPIATSQTPPVMITECRQQIQTLLETLRALEQGTDMRRWSDEIRTAYLNTLDGLACLEGHLYLHTLKNGDHPDGGY